jgi:hypothetical protein
VALVVFGNAPHRDVPIVCMGDSKPCRRRVDRQEIAKIHDFEMVLDGADDISFRRSSFFHPDSTVQFTQFVASEFDFLLCLVVCNGDLNRRAR